MCKYLSFLVHKSGDIYIGNPKSHSGVASGFGLAPDSYREAEWLENEPNSLVVRTEKHEDKSWWVANVIGRFPTRLDLKTAMSKGHPNVHYKFINMFIGCDLSWELEMSNLGVYEYAKEHQRLDVAAFFLSRVRDEKKIRKHMARCPTCKRCYDLLLAEPQRYWPRALAFYKRQPDKRKEAKEAAKKKIQKAKPFSKESIQKLTDLVSNLGLDSTDGLVSYIQKFLKDDKAGKADLAEDKIDDFVTFAKKEGK